MDPTTKSSLILPQKVEKKSEDHSNTLGQPISSPTNYNSVDLDITTQRLSSDMILHQQQLDPPLDLIEPPSSLRSLQAAAHLPTLRMEPFPISDFAGLSSLDNNDAGGNVGTVLRALSTDTKNSPRSACQVEDRSNRPLDFAVPDIWQTERSLEFDRFALGRGEGRALETRSSASSPFVSSPGDSFRSNFFPTAIALAIGRLRSGVDELSHIIRKINSANALDTGDADESPAAVAAAAAGGGDEPDNDELDGDVPNSPAAVAAAAVAAAATVVDPSDDLATSAATTFLVDPPLPRAIPEILFSADDSTLELQRLSQQYTSLRRSASVTLRSSPALYRASWFQPLWRVVEDDCLSFLTIASMKALAPPGGVESLHVATTSTKFVQRFERSLVVLKSPPPTFIVPEHEFVHLIHHEYSILSYLCPISTAGIISLIGWTTFHSQFSLVLERLPGPSLYSVLKASRRSKLPRAVPQSRVGNISVAPIRDYPRVSQNCRPPSLLAGHFEAPRHLLLLYALVWGAQLATSLEFLHLHRVIHRDIKPENIVFRRPPTQSCPGFVVLIDFAAASCVYPHPASPSRSNSASTSLERTRGKSLSHRPNRKAPGTSNYASPEILLCPEGVSCPSACPSSTLGAGVGLPEAWLDVSRPAAAAATGGGGDKETTSPPLELEDAVDYVTATFAGSLEEPSRALVNAPETTSCRCPLCVCNCGKSDVWSLGLVLRQVLGNSPEFDPNKGLDRELIFKSLCCKNEVPTVPSTLVDWALLDIQLRLDASWAVSRERRDLFAHRLQWSAASERLSHQIVELIRGCLKREPWERSNASQLKNNLWQLAHETETMFKQFGLLSEGWGCAY